MTAQLPAARRWWLAILVLTVLAANGREPRTPRAPPMPPAPRVQSAATDAAIATLTQQGVYASLQAAIEQARYDVHPASHLPDASRTYVANNPAQRYQAAVWREKSLSPAWIHAFRRLVRRRWISKSRDSS